MGPYDGLLGMIGKAAQALAPKIIPGAPALIQAGKSLTAAFAGLKQANGGKAPADAQKAHDALFNKVKAHADSTLGRLEG